MASPHNPPCAHCNDGAAHSAKKFIFGVDLDGVCADFYRGLRPIAADWLGVSQETLVEEPSFGLPEWGVPQAPGGYEELHRFAVNERDLFENLRPVEGAPQVLRKLSDAGVWIRIATHRFYIARSHARAASQTVTWLERYGIPYWDLCFVKDKAAVSSDLYVDDSPHNVAAVVAQGRGAVLFSPKEKVEGAESVRDWAELEAVVLRELGCWSKTSSPC